MPIEIIKETIELSQITTDSSGNCFLQKRINLTEGKLHNLLQTDIFEDAASDIDDVTARLEFAVSPYPVIPTNMPFIAGSSVFNNRFPSAGDDSILFKANATTRSSAIVDDLQQFPSLQIAANQKQQFYTDHLYICVHIMATADTTYENFAWSFMFTVESKNVSSLTHSIGVLAESHNAMCALVMSNGHMINLQTLRGNTFPMWRYGGIRPEHTLTPLAANAYFLPINTRDAEIMTTTPGIRQAVADARSMSPFDSAFGDKRPDWLKTHLNPGIVAGPVRDQWPPIKHADNGNVRML